MEESLTEEVTEALDSGYDSALTLNKVDKKVRKHMIIKYAKSFLFRMYKDNKLGSIFLKMGCLLAARLEHTSQLFKKYWIRL